MLDVRCRVRSRRPAPAAGGCRCQNRRNTALAGRRGAGGGRVLLRHDLPRGPGRGRADRPAAIPFGSLRHRGRRARPRRPSPDGGADGPAGHSPGHATRGELRDGVLAGLCCLPVTCSRPWACNTRRRPHLRSSPTCSSCSCPSSRSRPPGSPRTRSRSSGWCLPSPGWSCSPGAPTAASAGARC